MFRLLLVLALTATQLLSWSERSLYVCICGTGAVCVVEARSQCVCRKPRKIIHEESRGCCRHDATELAERQRTEAPSTRAVGTSSADECTLIPIASGQGQIASSGPTEKSRDDFATSAAADGFHAPDRMNLRAAALF